MSKPPFFIKLFLFTLITCQLSSGFARSENVVAKWFSRFQKSDKENFIDQWLTKKSKSQERERRPSYRNVREAVKNRAKFIKGLDLCVSINPDGSPGEVTSAYFPNSKVILLTAKVNDAPKGSFIRTTWKYLNKKDPFVFDYPKPVKGTGFRIFSMTRPTKGWPLGNYSVDIYENETYIYTMYFSVKKSLR